LFQPFAMVAAELPCPDRESLVDIRVTGRDIAQLITPLTDVNQLYVLLAFLQLGGHGKQRRDMPARPCSGQYDLNSLPS
jgi:hypothetical protein